MKPYLLYVAHVDRQVSDLHILMCENDRAACASAEALLRAEPRRSQIEICEGERMVATVERAPAH